MNWNIVIVLAFSTMLATTARAHEQCEWNKAEVEYKAGDRYRILEGIDALLDGRTCLLWDFMQGEEEVYTLSEAFGECARKGSRNAGGFGVMGWRLPTVAELTSLDVFSKDDDDYPFKENFINETGVWTSSAWPPALEEWAVVKFSQRGTVIVVPANPKSDRAQAFCVQ